MARIRPIKHDENLPLVGHLDELRTRVIVSVAAFGVALGLCFWQNHLILRLLNAPLHGHKLLTLSPAEPFTTTLKVSMYAAILLVLPVVLYQLYAFVLPAFSPRERRVALPLLMMVPVLFLAGVAFAYLVVVPAALTFLLHFNADQFRIHIRASEYYGFLSSTLIAVGVLFQVPVGILALTRLGVATPEMLRRNRRYAYLASAVIAALLPGVDPVSMLLETVPLVVLYEVSILLAAAFGRPGEADVHAPSAAGA
jgi:sec-independent protein translocase protein TatC